jgi:hypothetical protein
MMLPHTKRIFYRVRKFIFMKSLIESILQTIATRFDKKMSIFFNNSETI